MDERMLSTGVAMFSDAVQEDEIRNVVLLVACDGHLVVYEAIGWKDKEKGLGIEKDALFRLASNTRPVIATGISLLVDDGLLAYDDPVYEILPSFDNKRARLITLQHLPTHISRLRIQPIFFQLLIGTSPDHPDAPNLQLENERFGQVGPTVEVGK